MPAGVSPDGPHPPLREPAPLAVPSPAAFELESEADHLAQAHRYAEADELYRLAIAVAPANASLWWKRANNLFASGDNLRAAACFQESMRHTSAAIDPGLITAAWRGMATAYWRSYQPEKSVAAVEKVLALQPENPWNWLFAAFIYEYAGLLTCASLAYQKALEIDPYLDLARVGLQKIRDKG